ncbi:MAG TPA: hypothetical protein VGC76_06885 [Pyrinomonadaceae bacterium]|jgi:hypothetical protein
MSKYEIVHTITDWYDGARAGIADLNGVPHYYENQWLEDEQNWSDVYFLKSLDAETFALAIEDWEMWLRWEKAFKEGKTTQETHPVLPEEKQRHEELSQVLVERLIINPETDVRAKADFLYGQPTKVKWITQSKL